MVQAMLNASQSDPQRLLQLPRRSVQRRLRRIALLYHQRKAQLLPRPSVQRRLLRIVLLCHQQLLPLCAQHRRNDLLHHRQIAPVLLHHHQIAPVMIDVIWSQHVFVRFGSSTMMEPALHVMQGNTKIPMMIPNVFYAPSVRPEARVG